MNQQGVSDEDFEIFSMNIQENRLSSFKDWPFTENCNCTPDKMAAAGFYHCPTENEPDLVKCAICGKELDGWEPSDDPWEEHRSHSGQCPLVKLQGPGSENMTIKQFVELELARQSLRVTKLMDHKIAEFNAYVTEAREELQKLK